MITITSYGYRLTCLTKDRGRFDASPSSQDHPGPHWFFLPAGPGLGASYLTGLCQMLCLPGRVYLVDLPMDGDNLAGKLAKKYWQQGLIDLVQSYPDVILVAHSFSGMLALLTPELEHDLRGLVLMNTTTYDSFREQVNLMRQVHDLPDLAPAASQYHLSPSDATYQAFWRDYKYYCFRRDEMALGEELMSSFAFNSEAYHFAIQHFFVDYQAIWVPKKIPTMVITSEHDYICPPTAFTQDARYQRDNVMQCMIEQAGHYPWLKQGEQVFLCFDAYSRRMGIR